MHELMRGRRLFRSRRAQRFVVQAVFAACVALFIAYMVARATALDLSFEFLTGPAGFALSNQWITGYDSADRRIDAYLTGVWNTVRLVAVGIVLATLLGVVMGVARLSRNWLVSRVALTYVEVVRNTPLLVQIIFWWSAILLARLPRIEEGASLGDVVFISNRALALPWPQARGLTAPWVALLAVALLVAWLVRRWRMRVEDRTGQQARAGAYALAAFAALAAVAFLATGLPVGIDTPSLIVPDRGAPNYSGGIEVTPEFAALLLGLVVYTGSFITEIVRGSIQALPLGQSEAAAAVGLGAYQRLTLIILPQALRTMIPALTNQYLNLLKNSSLAVAIGYSELFFVGNVIINNVGHAVPMFIVIMLTYMAIGLLISVAMNALNRRVQLVGQ